MSITVKKVMCVNLVIMNNILSPNSHMKMLRLHDVAAFRIVTMYSYSWSSYHDSGMGLLVFLFFYSIFLFHYHCKPLIWHTDIHIMYVCYILIYHGMRDPINMAGPWILTNCDLVMPYGVKRLGQCWLCNGFMSDRIKPFPELILTSH